MARPPYRNAVLRPRVDPESMQIEEQPIQAPPEPITVTFAAASGPVYGTISLADGSPAAFHGWLELMDELERLRDRPG
jgi:hypothetical protein